MASAIVSRWKTNWTKCCLCQEHKNEEFISPPTRYTLEQDGYSMICNNIPTFLFINQMPIKLDLPVLDEGEGVEETLRANKAKYHNSCWGLFSSTRLEGARKRSAKCTTESESSTKVRRCSGDIKQHFCFLCGQPSSPSELRQAMTMNLNMRLNECTKHHNDGKLLAILSACDVVAKELKYHATCLTDLYNKERTQNRKWCFF